MNTDENFNIIDDLFNRITQLESEKNELKSIITNLEKDIENIETENLLSVEDRENLLQSINNQDIVNPYLLIFDIECLIDRSQNPLHPQRTTQTIRSWRRTGHF